MFRRCAVQHSFRMFGNTKVGQELAVRTKVYMNDLSKGSNKGNFVTRFLSRKRSVDRMQIEVDDHIAQELHWSYEYLMRLWTWIVIAPFFGALFSGKLAPSRFMVWFNIMSQDKYDRIWEHAHMAWILLGQACIALVFYDLSVYLRYPVFKYVFAPIYRSLKLYRPQAAGTIGIQDLKSGAARRRVQEQLNNNKNKNDGGATTTTTPMSKRPISGANRKASTSFSSSSSSGGSNNNSGSKVKPFGNKDSS